MSMHISCASKCSQYNYYYTVGVIINMLQKSKEKKNLWIFIYYILQGQFGKVFY